MNSVKNWFLELPWDLLVPVLVALTGYAIVHYFSALRDTRNKKRELRARFLYESYQKLARIVISADKWDFDSFRQVLIDVQLLGTKSQVAKAEELVTKFSEAWNNGGDPLIDLEPLLDDIRADLRKELSMEFIDNEFIWLKSIPSNEKQK